MEVHKKSQVREILEERDSLIKEYIDLWADEEEARIRVTHFQRDKYNKL